MQGLLSKDSWQITYDKGENSMRVTNKPILLVKMNRWTR